jgi:hypothetical protein
MIASARTYSTAGDPIDGLCSRRACGRWDMDDLPAATLMMAKAGRRSFWANMVDGIILSQ